MKQKVISIFQKLFSFFKKKSNLPEMTKFTVRVQLESVGLDTSIYIKLHKEMESAGFTSTIKTKNGKIYRLPDGEYSFLGEIQINDVLEKIKRILDEIDFEAQIVITESQKRLVSGLKSIMKRKVYEDFYDID
ncbi:hypothetical protein [Leptospira interrogans]|uniref:hypothetical protein n=1 Tax=Leptospira interrogans TaxID=173 RepID=UPI00027858BA|nr:hypothetical protein [Leptospira interrogans]EJP16347.1 hypothetical protein LEP1GSC080_0645 [Leptospira interrogans str. FPW2026]